MLFPLSKDCSTVGASSLPQCKAAEEPKRKQDDGQEDAQAGEAVFQDTNPAEREATKLRPHPQPDSPRGMGCHGRGPYHLQSTCPLAGEYAPNRQLAPPQGQPGARVHRTSWNQCKLQCYQGHPRQIQRTGLKGITYLE